MDCVRSTVLVYKQTDTDSLHVSPEVMQTCPFRESKSRNKVSVGEPAEGSLTNIP